LKHYTRLRASLAAVLLMATAGSIDAQTPATPRTAASDSAAIRAAALDYIEGWYNGDAERMERALHPELAKRIVVVNRESGRGSLDHVGAMSLVQRTKRGGGKDTPAAQRQKDIEILDLFRNVASVKVTMSGWIDYMHIARFNGRWVIVNVLWEFKDE
jgi:hypothetical protein